VKRGVARPGASDAKTAGISQACVGDDVVYVSGQVSTAPALDAQVEEAWAGVVALVEAAGGSTRDVVDLTVFVCGDSPDPERSVLSAAWRALQPLVEASVGEPPPAVTVVQVVALARPEMQIEIKAVARLGAGGAPG
jgi:enamine deaminase RidA (YjgF/YER057c/UK114 family)